MKPKIRSCCSLGRWGLRSFRIHLERTVIDILGIIRGCSGYRRVIRRLECNANKLLRRLKGICHVVVCSVFRQGWVYHQAGWRRKRICFWWLIPRGRSRRFAHSKLTTTSECDASQDTFTIIYIVQRKLSLLALAWRAFRWSSKPPSQIGQRVT